MRILWGRKYGNWLGAPGKKEGTRPNPDPAAPSQNSPAEQATMPPQVQSLVSGAPVSPPSEERQPGLTSQALNNPKGAYTAHLRTLITKTIPGIAFGTRVLK